MFGAMLLCKVAGIYDTSTHDTESGEALAPPDILASPYGPGARVIKIIELQGEIDFAAHA
jgi:hypothetical protein